MLSSHKSNFDPTKGCSREVHRLLRLRHIQFFPPTAWERRGLGHAVEKNDHQTVNNVGDGANSG
jgi:hypothetical protein